MTDIWTWVALILALLNVLVAASVTVHAVLWKRDIRSIIAWVGLAWLTPLVGGLLYFCFGINRIERKSRQTNIQQQWDFPRHVLATNSEISEARVIAHSHPNMVSLVTLGWKVTNRKITPGNLVEPLENGDEAYPAMLNAISQAERSITLLTYIFDSDPAGERFFEALVAARKRGVEVRVLIDYIGGRYSPECMADRLAKAGVPSAMFLPTRLPRLPNYANLRNHRKILVVDGRVGFTGGTNIRHGHCLNENPMHPAACLHFQITGPVVEHLQEAFVIDWEFSTGEMLHGDLWFAPCTIHPSNVWARGVAHGPDEDFEKLSDLMAGAVSCADKRIRIVTPYFLPSAPMIQALNVAAMRGVRVEIYIPEKNNIALVGWASAAQLWQNIQKGCNVFSVAPPFDHSKVMVVDDVWTLIGSSNWDPRSLRLNFEFNVECYDLTLAKKVNEIIDRKLARSTPVTMEQLNSRPFWIRLRDGLSRLMTPYL